VCVIIHLLPGAMIAKEHLYNAVYNNWHGYGLILKDGNGRLQLIRKFNDKGNDPEEIYDLLEDNMDIERYLHVRYSTRGAQNLDNTQPFEIYNSASRQVFFMHNGTLGSYGNFQATGKSDTVEFCEKILQPALLRWTGEKGKADYTDEEFFRLVVEKQWTYASKGLFISNDLPELRIGNGWSEYKQENPDAPKIWVSNTEYFDKLTRGPEHLRREAERKKKEEEERKASTPFPRESGQTGGTTSTSGTTTNAIKEWNPSLLAKSATILRALSDIVDNWQLDDPSLVAKMKFISYDEWKDYVIQEGEWTTAAVLEKFAEHICTLAKDKAALTRKHDGASKRIETLTRQVREFEAKEANNVSKAAA
jgi:predicted glutamine amidotransferase